MLIKNARFILTPEKILENADIEIENGKITQIGNIAGNADIDASGKIIIPGLINTHTHVAMSLFRGLGDDLPLMEWLKDYIWPREAKLTSRDVYLGTLLSALEIIRSGTTTFSDMYFHMNSVADAVQKSGIRAVLSWGILDKEFSDQPGDPVINAENFVKRWHGEERIYPAPGPHSIYTCSKETLIRAKEISDKYNTINHIHLSETKKEVEQSLEKNRARPAEYLEKIDFFSHRTLVAHAIWLNEREINILAKQKVSVSHCPISNMKLASGVMPFTQIKEAGINISLGTDGAASNNSLDMFEIIKATALLHKLNEMNAKAAASKDVFNSATIGGAKALHLDSRIGSIEVGKDADLVVLNVNKPHWQPLYNPISNLVYSAKSSDVETVICNGKIIMKNKKILTLDEEKILNKAEKVKEKFM